MTHSHKQFTFLPAALFYSFIPFSSSSLCRCLRLSPAEAFQEQWTETYQLPKPEWACKHEKPSSLEPYAGRRIYAEAKPDR